MERGVGGQHPQMRLRAQTLGRAGVQDQMTLGILVRGFPLLQSLDSGLRLVEHAGFPHPRHHLQGPGHEAGAPGPPHSRSSGRSEAVPSAPPCVVPVAHPFGSLPSSSVWWLLAARI